MTRKLPIAALLTALALTLYELTQEVDCRGPSPPVEMVWFQGTPIVLVLSSGMLIVPSTRGARVPIVLLALLVGLLYVYAFARFVQCAN